jgi:hypothetical protein
LTRTDIVYVPAALGEQVSEALSTDEQEGGKLAHQYEYGAKPPAARASNVTVDPATVVLALSNKRTTSAGPVWTG